MRGGEGGGFEGEGLGEGESMSEGWKAVWLGRGGELWVCVF